MGNVTHKIPGLQSYVQVVPGVRGHTLEFQEAVGGPEGHRAIEIGAKAMAMTAVDILQDENTYKKIGQTKALIEASGSKALIEIDGGVNIDNAHKLFEAGADVLVAGNAVFSAEDPEKMIELLKQ